ncbi:MAG: exodeoxyribonuclease VII large subunit [Cocleimonas sp.]|nr:exodeoxyribonuclease VII large subunit [Cocleimonas sp.]
MQNTNRTILNVSELNAEVSLLLKQGFPLLWVEGEISNFSCPTSGHFYFSLKDASAQIRCAMFRSRNRQIDVKPKNGLHVLVRGRIGLYETRGEFQLIAEHMEDAGAGLLQKQFEMLKAKLRDKGWFDTLFKKELPAFPQQIGIISSPTGAALRDILNVLKRRCPQIPLLIYPAAVQGTKAAIELETAIRQANLDKSCDVLIIARGGGSIEDLAAFNDENLARALHETDIPLVSGIGHEIDFTIADFIVDQRAPTPSAAAELVSPDSTPLRNNLQILEQKMHRALQITLKQKNEKFVWLSKRLQQQKPSYQLQQQSQRLDELQMRLKQQMRLLLSNKSTALESRSKQLQANAPRRFIETKQQKLVQIRRRLQQAIEAKIYHKKSILALQLVKLDAMSPLKTLQRGYAIARDESKQRVISSVTQVKRGDKVNIKVKDGEIISKVI